MSAPMPSTSHDREAAGDVPAEARPGAEDHGHPGARPDTESHRPSETRPGTDHPRWLQELDLALATNPQLVVSGNIRDRHLLPRPGGLVEPVATLDAIGEVLRANGYCSVSVLDPIDGWSLLPGWDPAAPDGGPGAGPYAAPPAPGDPPLGLEALQEGVGAVGQAGLTGGVMQAAATTGFDLPVALMTQLLTAVVRAPVRSALIVDHAARLSRSGPDPAVDRLFATAQKRAAHAGPAFGTDRFPLPPDAVRATVLFNPVIWLVERHQELPAWLVAAAGVRVVSIPEPTLGTRTRAARIVGPAFPGYADLDAPGRDAFASRLGAASTGMTVADLESIARIAVDRRLPPKEVEDAVRCFRVGLLDNPWQDPELRTRIRGGLATLGDQVLGQPQAIRKSLDILIRSTIGLSGAQSGASATRPQGVLFFGGPTGVGKTELAKCLAELVFGTREAMSRFDMSEYAEAHSEARLIGAPPGYVGYESGGQLTDAVRQRPFSLLLFDEVEKAHPRVLDKFLQVLEDGRLTDGNGATVHFTECLLVFTSNLGAYRDRPDGTREPVAAPGTPYEEVQQQVRSGIERYFVSTIARPELLNRVGENIVVFDFISPETALRILALALDRVAASVAARTGLTLEIGREALDALAAEVLEDMSLGGRRIANVVEAGLVNPLGRALFAAEGAAAGAWGVRVRALGADRYGRTAEIDWVWDEADG